jgi:hypothetical protein
VAIERDILVTNPPYTVDKDVQKVSRAILVLPLPIIPFTLKLEAVKPQPSKEHAMGTVQNGQTIRRRGKISSVAHSKLGGIVVTYEDEAAELGAAARCALAAFASPDLDFWAGVSKGDVVEIEGELFIYGPHKRFWQKNARLINHQRTI